MKNFKYLLSIFVFIGSLGWGIVSSLPDDKLHMVFCDVGQGDATLIIKGKTQVLIDGGPNDKVLTCLSEHMPFWDRKLEMVILTHPDADHINGIVSVVERYDVRQLVSNSLSNDSGSFNKLREEIIAKKIPVLSPKNGDKLRLGKLEFDILWPKEKLGNELVWTSSDTDVLGETYTGNFNQTAIVTKIIYGQFEALMTGDVGVSEEQTIGDLFGQADILKVAHHGSKYSTSDEFLKEVMPSLAIISVGATNSYGHPAPETLERLKNDLPAGRVLRTDLVGEIEVVSDGTNWYTKKE